MQIECRFFSRLCVVYTYAIDAQYVKAIHSYTQYITDFFESVIMTSNLLSFDAFLSHFLCGILELTLTEQHYQQLEERIACPGSNVEF